MTGQALINSIMYDMGKVQVLTTDTNYRTMALDWLNRVIKDISSRAKHWTWLEKTSTFPTVASQMSYDLPTDISGYNIFDVKQSETPSKLIYIDQRRLDELEPDPTTYEAVPRWWSVWANSLRLYPIPDAAYTMTMRYLKTITALTDGSGTTDIPTKFDDIIIAGAKVYALQYEPEWGNLSLTMQIYESGIRRMLDENNRVLDDDGISESHPYDNKDLFDPYPININKIGL